MQYISKPKPYSNVTVVVVLIHPTSQKAFAEHLTFLLLFFFHTLPPSHPPQPPPPLESYQDNLLVHPSDRDPDLSILN